MKSMKTWSTVLTILVMSGLLLGSTVFAASGKEGTPPPVVQVGETVTPKLSPVMRDVAYVPPVRKLDREEINPIKNPGLFLPDLGLTGTDSKGLDPLLAGSRSPMAAPSPILNFDGQGDFNLYSPPDTTGDVGPNHFVQMVNVETAVYDKSGTLIDNWANNQLWAGFGGPCETENDGDPIVLYDEMADRWLLTQFAVPSGNERMCFAVSQSSDPTGAYYLYSFPMPDFPDYPKIGIWSDGYYLGTNTGYPNQYYAHVFQRTAMLTGAAAGHQYVGNQANFLMPADADTQPMAGDPGKFYTFYDGGYPNHPAGVDRIELYQFDVDWVTPANSTFTMVQSYPIAAFNYTTCGFFNRNCLPQQGTTNRLDAVDPWPMVRLQYRNLGAYQAMVGNFTVDVDGTDHAGIRWFELRNQGAGWTLYQEGTWSPDADHRFMGSIAVDGSGNLALGYSVTGSSMYPSIRYTVHAASDPLGTMQAEATLMTGAGSQTSSQRWGDYSATVVDPTDDCTFWITNMYHDTTDAGYSWDTRIGTFRVPGCTGSLGPTGTLEGTVYDDDTNAPIAGAEVEAALTMTQTIPATTNATGDYEMTVPVGTYTLTVSAYGYEPTEITSVDVISGGVTTEDAYLVPMAMYTVSGTVTDVNTGWPLYASITIDGYPGGPVWTNPETGFYSVELAEGITYTFHASAFYAGYVADSAEVGPLTGNATQDFALGADLAACTAPGYYLAGGVVQTFDGTTLPAGWTVINNVGTLGWSFNNPGARTNLTGGAGNFAIADSDNAGSGVTMNTELRTPVLDFTGVSFVNLEFKYDFYWYSSGNSEVANVDVSNDGGTTWNNVWTRSGASDRGPKTAVVNISALAANEPDVVVRFHYYNAVYEWWWQVDDVKIGVSCNAPTGGLVVGNVYDTNTSLPLVGAVVSNESDGSFTTVTTPDTAVDDGFYYLYTEGTEAFTATMTGGYVPAYADVTAVNGDVVAHDFSLGMPSVMVEYDTISAVLGMGESATFPITVTNVGSAILDYEWQEVDGGYDPVFAVAAPAANVIQGGGFEEGTPNPYWTEASTNFGTPLCDAVCGTGGGTAGARTGDWWAWFGGANAYELASVSQDVVIPAGTANLSFWLWIGTTGSPAADTLEVTIDGDVVFQVSADQQGSYSAYTQVTVDVSAYADGGTHTVLFEGEQTTSTTTNFNVDDVILDSGGGPSGVLWLFEEPVSGTLPVAGSVVADITLDAMYAALPGNYYATLVLNSNDPLHPTTSIPVTMTVSAPPDMGKLEGVVTGLGYCDINPDPLAGLDVVIEGMTNTFTATTNTAGEYAYYLDPDESPFIVSVDGAAQNYTFAQAVVDVTASMTTTQDFDLRLLEPCVSTEPAGLTVNVPPGASVATVLTLGNNGAAATGFELQEQPGTPLKAYAGQLPVALPKIAGLPASMVAETGVAGAPVVGIPASGAAPEDIGTAWETMAALPSARVFAAVIADQNGYVYVIGGTSDGGATTPTNTNYRYDTATNTWATMAVMPTTVDSIDGVEINNKIYVVGDSDAAMYIYDIASNTWSQVAANGGYTARAQYQAVAIGTDVYILGGIVGGSASTTEVWKYNTLTGTWSAGVPMQKSRTSFSAGAIDGMIYVAGGVLFPGFTPDMTAEKFDGTSWTYIASVPAGGGTYTRWSYNADGVGADGLWLGAGRRDAGWAVLNHAGYYNPETDTWTDSPTIPTLTQGRVYCEGDVASDGYFYVIGGRDSAGSIAYATNERLMVGTAVVPEVPWLSEAPITGTIGADSYTVVDVTFTAYPTMTIGSTYTATLKVKTDDPMYPTIEVPVTMHIVADSYGVDVSADQTGMGMMGTVVTYTVTITNSSLAQTDSYTITLGTSEWTTTVDMSEVGPLDPGETAVVQVVVQVPTNTPLYAMDAVQVTVTSQGDPTVEETVTLTTHAQGYWLLMPLVTKQYSAP